MEPGQETGPGTLRGSNHSAWHPEVQRRRDISDRSATAALLLEIVDATESESRAEGFRVAPAAYETLAVICRQRKDRAAEIAILERFAHQKHAPGATPPRLLERLARLKAQSSP